MTPDRLEALRTAGAMYCATSRPPRLPGPIGDAIFFADTLAREVSGLVASVLRMQAVLAAEAGREGRPGWRWEALRGSGPDRGQWVRDLPEGLARLWNGPDIVVAWGGPNPGWALQNGALGDTHGELAADALDAMERADAYLDERNDAPSSPPTLRLIRRAS